MCLLSDSPDAPSLNRIASPAVPMVPSRARRTRSTRVQEVHMRLSLTAVGRRAVPDTVPEPLDIQAVRRHFVFPELGRVVTINAASTQPPRELLALYQSLAPGYDNVHRGQSTASQQMTARFEE